MKITFLGTGAAQGVPPVFSRNRFFDYVRKTKGKELRSKASLRLGEFSQIDFGPDTNWQNLRFGMDMFDVKNLFITHSHSDHFSYFELFDIYSMAFEIPEDCPEHPLKLYLSKPAADWIYNKLMPVVETDCMKNRIIPMPLDYFKTYKCDDISFDTVKGKHISNGNDEHSINYLFKNKEGKTLLYAVDTGYYSDETFEYLKGRKSDVIIMECTFGYNQERGGIEDGHLNLQSLNKQIQRLAEIGFMNEKTPVYLTHISSIVAHKHKDFQKTLNQYDFNYILSYDGLSFEFGNS